jgi:proteasome lid subunit RPN8/RPN11
MVRSFPITESRIPTPALTGMKWTPKEHFLTLREVEDSGWDPAFYHSHSHSPAAPSDTDIRLASYPTNFYLIVSPHKFDGNNQQIEEEPQVRAFLIGDEGVTEEPVVITRHLV